MRLLLRWIFCIACVIAALLLLDIGFGQYGQTPRLVGFISRNAGTCLLLITGAYLWRTCNSINNKTKSSIMDPKNLEAAERMARKRRELQAMYDILSSYVTSASVTVSMPDFLSSGMLQQRQVTIKSDTFNALMVALVEKEIKNIDEFVKSL